MLIVEDHELMLRSLKGMLRREPVTLELVTDAEAALEAVKRTTFDVIISDNTLPGMTGLELLNQVRQRSPTTTRILMTGSREPEVMRGAINRAEVFRYLVKPFKTAELLETVKSGVELAERARNSNPFGKYQLVRRLAAGGMAEVHLAKLTGMASFSKAVVIKMMLPDLASEAEFIEMFLDEARLVARLTHPNIAQVFEMGKTENRAFIAMEHIDGETLAALMHRRKGPLPVTLTLPVIMQLLDALEYAHALTDEDGKPLNLVHRDISPGNVMVTRQGYAKLLDFGIAKSTNSLHKTRVGGVKGKLSYMSPEQVDGGALDQRSDLFSVGAMLYEMIAGKRPFEASSEVKAKLAIREGRFAPMNSIVPEVASELEAIVARSLMAEPGARYQSASEFREALRGLVQKIGVFIDPGSVARELAAVMKAPAANEAAGDVKEAGASSVIEIAGSPQAMLKTPVPAMAPKRRSNQRLRVAGIAAAIVAIAAGMIAVVAMTRAAPVEPSAAQPLSAQSMVDAEPQKTPAPEEKVPSVPVGVAVVPAAAVPVVKPTPVVERRAGQPALR